MLARYPIAALVILAACAGGPVGPSATDSGATSATSATSTASSDGMNSTSEGSTTTTTTTTTMTTGVTGETAATDVDACPDPLSLDCDIWAQDCCDGEKCNLWADDGGAAWTATRCVPVDRDPDKVGDACSVYEEGVSGFDSCEAGSLCVTIDWEPLTRRCVALCQGSEDACAADPVSCCPTGSYCGIVASPIIRLCVEWCDPIAQNCAGVGEACYGVGKVFQCIPDASAEGGAVGDPCEYLNVCDPGASCEDPASFPGCDPRASGCCVPFCDLDAPECPPGTACRSWFGPGDAPAGLEDVGLCNIPP